MVNLSSHESPSTSFLWPRQSQNANGNRLQVNGQRVTIAESSYTVDAVIPTSSSDVDTLAYLFAPLQGTGNDNNSITSEGSHHGKDIISDWAHEGVDVLCLLLGSYAAHKSNSMILPSRQHSSTDNSPPSLSPFLLNLATKIWNEFQRFLTSTSSSSSSSLLLSVFLLQNEQLKDLLNPKSHTIHLEINSQHGIHFMKLHSQRILSLSDLISYLTTSCSTALQSTAAISSSTVVIEFTLQTLVSTSSSSGGSGSTMVRNRFVIVDFPAIDPLGIFQEKIPSKKKLHYKDLQQLLTVEEEEEDQDDTSPVHRQNRLSTDEKTLLYEKFFHIHGTSTHRSLLSTHHFIMDSMSSTSSSSSAISGKNKDSVGWIDTPSVMSTDGSLSTIASAKLSLYLSQFLGDSTIIRSLGSTIDSDPSSVTTTTLQWLAALRCLPQSPIYGRENRLALSTITRKWRKWAGFDGLALSVAPLPGHHIPPPPPPNSNALMTTSKSNTTTEGSMSMTTVVKGGWSLDDDLRGALYLSQERHAAAVLERTRLSDQLVASTELASILSAKLAHVTAAKRAADAALATMSDQCVAAADAIRASEAAAAEAAVAAEADWIVAEETLARLVEKCERMEGAICSGEEISMRLYNRLQDTTALLEKERDTTFNLNQQLAVSEERFTDLGSELLTAVNELEELRTTLEAAEKRASEAELQSISADEKFRSEQSRVTELLDRLASMDPKAPDSDATSGVSINSSSQNPHPLSEFMGDVASLTTALQEEKAARRIVESELALEKEMTHRLSTENSRLQQLLVQRSADSLSSYQNKNDSNAVAITAFHSLAKHHSEREAFWKDHWESLKTIFDQTFASYRECSEEYKRLAAWVSKLQGEEIPMDEIFDVNTSLRKLVTTLRKTEAESLTIRAGHEKRIVCYHGSLVTPPKAESDHSNSVTVEVLRNQLRTAETRIASLEAERHALRESIVQSKADTPMDDSRIQSVDPQTELLQRLRAELQSLQAIATSDSNAQSNSPPSISQETPHSEQIASLAASQEQIARLEADKARLIAELEAMKQQTRSTLERYQRALRTKLSSPKTPT